MTRESESELGRSRLRCKRLERELELLRSELAQCRAVLAALAQGNRITISDRPPPSPPMPSRQRLN
jgi:hypothetical protein